MPFHYIIMCEQCTHWQTVNFTTDFSLGRNQVLLFSLRSLYDNNIKTIQNGTFDTLSSIQTL